MNANTSPKHANAKSASNTTATSNTTAIRSVLAKIKTRLLHEERKLEKQRAEAHEAGQYLRYSQIADSLTANPSAYPKGCAKTNVCNIHTNLPEEISLNPAFDAPENAQLLYKKARKGKRGHETALSMIAETEKNIAKLKEIFANINEILAKSTPQDGATGGNANEPTDDDVKIVLELAAEFLPKEQVKGKGAQFAPPPFKRYEFGGWEIFMGKNSRQNDELSIRFAKPSDVWLHVVGYAGSHVIIRRPKNAEMPPREVIEKAAQLAVWNSKAKHTSFAEVHVTEARYVRKRRHAPPGEVIAERCKTIRVEPKEIS